MTLAGISPLPSRREAHRSLDHAQEIYRNVTIEKVAFLSFLSSRVSEEEARRHLWGSLVEETRATVSSLLAAPLIMEELLFSTREDIQKSFNAVSFSYVLNHHAFHSADDG